MPTRPISPIRSSAIDQYDLAIGPNTYEFNKTPVRQAIGFKFLIVNNRGFLRGWFEKYPWIEYSVNKHKAFCHTCRLFAKGSASIDASYRTQIGHMLQFDLLHTKRQSVIKKPPFV